MRSQRLSPLVGLVATLLAGCASQAPFHPETATATPGAPLDPSALLAQQGSNAPAVTPPVPQTTAPPAPAAKPVAPPAPSYADARTGHLLLDRLLPRDIPDRQGWHNDIFSAFSHLKIPYTPQYFCAVLAVAEQESGFQPDPVTPNLAGIVRGEIEKRRQKYLIPSFVVDTALAKRSPDGRSYKERIDALRTKKEMNALYEDMVRELPFGQTIFEHKNPIRDGGPMQVSVAFAETHVRAWPYPYAYKNLRDEVFTRRGSVYFGTAILLQYPAPYRDMVYRFADFNVGRYSSRNAAFQLAVARLTGARLAVDGDLMLYQNKMERVTSDEPSETQKALMSLSGRLRMNPAEIIRDLRQEKLSGFAQTPLYAKVFALADQAAGRPVAREAIPQIVLVSPKIKSHLTTEWFARRVDGRYQRCLARGAT